MAADMLDRPISQFLEYWSLIRRYRWHVLLAWCALVLISVILIARLPNVFEATTTILVNPQQVPEKYVAPAVISDPSARLNTLTQQVLSRTRLQQISDKFQLYASLQKTHSPEEIIEGMRHDITIQVKQGSGPELSTFTITYQAKDPDLVATVANELANSFIQWNVHSREMQVSGTKEFLQSELDEARENLQALSGLRAALLANHDALNRLDAEKLLLSRLPEPVALAATGTPVLGPRAQLEAEKQRLEANLQQLRARYSDRYPDVLKAQRELGAVTARLAAMKPDSNASVEQKPAEASTAKVRIEVLDKEMKRLMGEQEKLQAQIQAYQSKVDAAPLREQQLVELNRNYDISKQHYQALLDKSFNIDMAADLEQKQKGERFTVLDPARRPAKPVKPKRMLLLGVAVLCSLGVSTLWVIGMNTISPSLKTETELKALLPRGVAVVGLIPSIRIAADDTRERRIFLLATGASLAMVLAALAVIWHIRAVL